MWSTRNPDVLADQFVQVSSRDGSSAAAPRRADCFAAALKRRTS
jgi:hypothetical protein